MKNSVIIIPTRMDSKRLPGKFLIKILGKTILQRVWQQCCKALPQNQVYVATDSEKIKDHCNEKGMQCIMTGVCLTGTDRVAQAYLKLNKHYDTVINVQADEPLIEPGDILKVAEAFQNNRFSDVHCGMCEIKSANDFINPNIIKIVFNKNKKLLYASRAAIPYHQKSSFVKAYKQVCIYAFSPEDLLTFNNKKSYLEYIEDIEILRFLEKGYDIKMVEVSNSSISVDVREDLIKVENAIKQKK